MANKQVIDVIARFQGDISNISGAITKIEDKLGSIKLAPNVEKNFLNLISKLQSELSNFEAKAQSGISSMADSRALEKSGKKIIETYNQILNQIKVMGNVSGSSFEKMFPEAITKEIKEATGELKKYQDSHDDVQRKIQQANKDLAKQVALSKQLASEKEKIAKKEALSERDEKRLTSAKRARTAAYGARDDLQAKIDVAAAQGKAKLTKSGALDKRFKGNAEFIAELEKVEKKIQETEARYENLMKEFGAKVPKSQIEAEMKKNESAIKASEKAISEINADINKLNDQDVSSFEKLVSKIKELTGIDLGDLTEADQIINKISDSIEELKAEKTKEISNSVKGIGDAAKGAIPGIQGMEQGLHETGEATKDLEEAKNQVKQLRDQVIQFFSIGNAVELFKRSIRSAFDTVKELDATMTEAAVVTDFSVGDMWDMLPQYSAEATKLGVKINDLYGATTLYLQQGLKMNAAMAVGTETMKMARIAGMEATEATQAMTAALRGFNMEINEMSAQRVNDVYSELAAITAADTSQIATAMSKTASIAASANMEFETTSALLAQIIETTQEAPETAGTALKTIIARFSEVKKLASEGKSTGEDEEGEIINVNNIQKALRTVGISMEEFFAGTEGLDDVLMRLAEKWKDLDFETQRYIATTAAGSRQQSRFIAMMSDYERTVELANAANNSAGASQEQFGKTLESLDSKLKNLKNAWDQFVMGLANNEVIKGAVDFLTFILNSVNKFIELTGPLKTFTTIFLSFLAFKGGKKLFGGVEKLIETLSPTKISGNVKDGMSSGVQNAAGTIESTVRNAVAKGATDGFNQANGMQGPFPDPGKNKGDVPGLDPSKSATSGKFQGLKNFTQKSGNALKTRGGQIGAGIGIAAGSLIKDQLIKVFDNTVTTTAEKLNIFSEALDGLSEQINSTKEVLDGLDQTQATYKNYQKTLKSLDKSSKDYQKNVRENNDLIRGIIQSDLGSKLDASLYEFSDGVYQVTDQFWTEYEKISEQQLYSAYAAQDALNAQKAQAEFSSKVESSANTSQVTQKEQDNITAAAGAAGTIGTLAGVAVGAAIGSAVPILGTIIGGAIGGLVGALGALITGEIIATQGMAQEELEKGLTRIGEAGLQVTDEQLRKIKEGKDLDSEGTDEELATFMNEYNAVYGTGAFEELITSSDLTASELNELATAAYNAKQSFIENQKSAAYNYAKSIGKTEEEAKDFSEFYGKYYSEESATKIQESLAGGFDSLEQSQKDSYLKSAGEAQGYQYAGGKFYSGGQEIDEALQETLKENAAQMYASGTMLSDIFKVYESGAVRSDAIGISNMSEQERVVYNKANFNAEGGVELTTSNLDIATDEGALTSGKYMNSDGTANIDSFRDDLTKLQSYLSKNSSDWQTLEGYKTLDNASLRAMIEDGFAYYGDINRIESTLETQAVDDYSQVEGAFADLGLTKEDFNLLKAQGATSRGDFEALLSVIGSFNLKNAEELIGFLGGASGTEFIQKGKDVLSQAAVDIGKSELPGFEGFDHLDNTIINDVYGQSEEAQTKLVEFLNGIDKSAEKLTEEQQKRLNEALAKTDLDNVDSVQELFEVLDELGITGDYSANEIITLTGAIEQLSVASETSIKTIVGALDKIRNNGPIDQAVYDEILSLSPDIAGNFIKVGEQYYLSDGVSGEAVASSLESTLGTNLTDSARAVNYGEVFEQRGYKTGDELGSSRIYSTLKALGINTDGMDLETRRQTYEDMYSKYYGEGGAIYKNNLEAYRSSLATSGNIDLLNGSNAQQGLSSATLANFAEQNGLDVNELIEYKDHLTSIGIESQETAAKVAAANTLMNEGIKELGTNWEEWKETLSAQDTAGYSSTLNNLRSVVEKLIGSTEGLSDEWLTNEKNMKLFERAAKGDIKAIDELRKAAAQEIIMGLDLQDEQVEADLLNLINNFDGTNLEVGASLNDTALYEGLNAMIESGAVAADEIQNLLDAIGFEPQFETESYTLQDEDIRRGYVEVPKLDAMGQVVGTTRQAIESGMTAGATIQVPKIVGKNKNGSGGHARVTGIFKGKASAVAPPKINKPSGGGGGGGGSESKPKKWENPYDEYYNTTEKLNEELRKREKLERDYENILKNRKANLKDIRKNQLDQIATLRKEIDYQKQLAAGRKDQLKNIGKETYTDSDGKEKTFSQLGVTKYAKYDQKKGTAVIDWKAINKITNEEKGAAVEAYISRLEEISGQLEDSEDAIWAAEDQIEEIKDQNKQSYLELEERVYDAIVEREQKKIDEYQNLVEAIDEANNELLASVRESIDLERQIRDNTKKEEDIQEKENRLAYLRMDTSGASDLEIKKLEEELANDREQYQDQLIDQKLSNLEKDAQKAQEQRQRQIEIMNAQLEYQKENGEFWGEVNSLLSSAFNKDGTLNNNSKLVKLLADSEAFKGMSEMGKEDWINKLVEEFLIGMSGFEEWRMDKAIDNNEKIKFANGQTATYNKKTGKWENSSYTYEGVSYDAEKGTFVYDKAIAKAQPKPTTTSTPKPAETPKPAATPKLTSTIKKGVAAAIWNGGYGWGTGDTRTKRLKEVFGSNNGIQDIVNKGYKYVAGIDASGYSYSKMRKKFKGYKTGGLADFTGPAWLDGTKSKPEIVLNAQDSKNFIVLKDILSSLMNGSKIDQQSSGDNYFDIQISVDELSNDYDVDRLAERIKKQIYDDSIYRNVNAINLLR